MKTTNQIGILGESKVLAYLVERGYSIFLPFDGHEPFDLIAYKDNILQRVSVKTTTSKSKSGKKWVLRLAQINWKGRAVVFDGNKIDILAAYIVPEDRVVLIDPKTITSKYEIHID